jgi:hypothetical protein
MTIWEERMDLLYSKASFCSVRLSRFILTMFEKMYSRMDSTLFPTAFFDVY